VNPLRVSSTELFTWDAKANGTVIEMPGGDLRYAGGVEYRAERYSDNPDTTGVARDLPGQFLPINGGSRDVTSVYLEARVPITGKDWHVLPFYRFDLVAAGRLENYSDAGVATVPTVGIEWRPLSEDFMLRASYAENYRPASLQQLFAHPLQAGTERFVDPLRGTLESSFISIGGNPNLKPETANQWTAGVVITPSAIRGLRVSVDWLQIARQNEIASQYDIFGPDFLAKQPSSYTRLPYEGDIAFQRENPGLPIPKIDPKTGLPAGQLEELIANYTNIGATIGDYLDFRLTYSLPTANLGTWTFDSSTTYTMSLRILSDPMSGTFTEYAGGGDYLPNWRTTASLTWDFKNLRASAFANYTGKFSTSNPNTGDPFTVDSFLTFNVQASYKLPWQMKVTAGINNLLDANPPLDINPNFASAAYNYYVHSPLGRQYYFELSKKF
jgi:iron complex outermembrane recepter protein